MPVVEKASNFTISGCARLYEIHGNATIHQLTLDIDTLKKVQSVVSIPRSQSSQKDYETKKKCGPCFKGTREALLREMMDWVIGQGESKMYILSGLAGIGKSTVVYTVATQADERGRLGASFFFSRDKADHRSGKKFFTSIAYQLCLFNEEFAQAIAGALITKRGSTATTGSPQEQLDVLILDPLGTIATQNTPQTLIVVDAVDECDAEDVPSVLTGLRQIVQALPFFKIILTTRPHLLPNDEFTTQGDYKIFHLQNIEDKVVNDDIRLYLKHSLSQKQARERLNDVSEDWYARDTQIESLVQAAGKLFIIASMAVRYILNRFWSNPAGRIEDLLRAFSQNHTPFDNLQDFYSIILRSAVPADCQDTRLIERYQAVIGTVVLIPIPLSINTLAALTGVEAKQVSVVLRQLQSIILIGSDNIPIIYHKSFVDYIVDPAHCKDINLRINTTTLHSWLAMRCFEIMDKHLKYNILDLGKPAQFLRNEDALAKDRISDAKLQEKIPSELQYACVYWADHLNHVNIEDIDVMEELQKFANTHVLHWFELLSFIKKLDSAHRAILLVLKLLKPTSSDLCQLLSDGQRVISKFYETIKRSALHTYYSALPFMPTESMLYRRYIKEAPHNVVDVEGVPEKWDALVACSIHGEEVDNVQFSFDNAMFASWSRECNGAKGMLRIWDSATATPISMIKGSDFAIPNDFSTVASFNGNIVALYNVTGSERGTTFNTRAKIFRVAISSESSRIAAGLSDGTVCLWNSGNGELVGSYQNDYYSRGSLQFTATGARLAYSSANGVFKLRNGNDGNLIANLVCGSADASFSGDGSRIASLQPGSRLKLWSCEDGQLVGIAKNAGFEDLAISANGSLLATSDNWQVKLWSGNSGNPLPLVEVLEIDPFSISFSPDDTLAITTGSNIKLYNIKSHSFISTLPFTADLGAPVAFSLDCTLLAAGSKCGSVYLWDIQGIEGSELSPSSNPTETNGEVTALALSLNCSRVACGFNDGTIELWDTAGPKKQRIIAHRHHQEQVMTLSFSPDGSLFASGSPDGTIKLWKGEDGELLCGTLQYRRLGLRAWSLALGVSNNLLAAAGANGLGLWDLKSLDRIHAFEGSFKIPLSFSADSNLIGAVEAAIGGIALDRVIVFNIAKRTIIATFDVPGRGVHRMEFLSDKSKLVTQLCNDDFLTCSLVDKVIQRATFEHFAQLPNIPKWNSISVWMNTGGKQLRALFSRDDETVPMLRIPRELQVQKWAQGHSMIALGCANGRIILLRICTNSRR